MKKGTVWSKIVGSYLLVNGLFALAITGYYIYTETPITIHSPRQIYIFNNVVFPCASALIGYYLLLVPNKIRWATYYLYASIIGIGYGEIIYWSGHGYVLSVYMSVFGLFFAINFTAIIGIWLLYKHSLITGNQRLAPQTN